MTSWQAAKGRICAALVLGALSTQAAHADGTLTIVATPNPVNLGSSVGIDVLISGIQDLYAWQFTLNFDAATFQSTSVSEGAFMLSGGNFGSGTTDNVGGSVSYVYNSLVGFVPGLSGSGVLAHFNFNAAAVGAGAFSFGDVVFLDSTLNTLGVQAVGGSVNVISDVPEPASALLLALGAAALALQGRRRMTA